MKRSFACLLAFAIAGCTSPTAIEGRVIVGEGVGGRAVVAVLWQITLAPDETKADRPLVEQPVVLAQQAVGTTTSKGGAFPYAFHSLAKGRYLVGAYVDFDNDGYISGDELSIDLLSPPLDIDPDDDARRKATRDVYVRMSAPDRLTVSGVLHRSPLAAGKAAEILLLNGPLSDPDAEIIARTSVPAGGLDLPWRIYNVPAGAVHALALDDLSLEGFVALSPQNPIQVTLEGGEEVRDVELWMDRAPPGLGSLEGEVTLNAALPRTRVSLWVFNENPLERPDATLVAWVNAQATTERVPFSISGLPLETLYLAALITTVDPDGSTHSTTRLLLAHDEPRPLALGPERPSLDGLVFPMGVGRVSGTIHVENATEGLGLWAFAMVDGGTRPSTRQYEVLVAPKSGTVSVPYVLFGLEDGEYRMQLVPDTTGVDGPNDELAMTPPFVFNGAPAQVTIEYGGRAASDFTLRLKAQP